jgi:hypothetical protein
MADDHQGPGVEETESAEAGTERPEDQGPIREELREDEETGSTETDPSAEETGPYGRDPMGGPAPSG